jgi:hypothetical protein
LRDANLLWRTSVHFRQAAPVAETRSGKKGQWATPLGDFVTPLVEPVLAKQGFGEASLIGDWSEIVGETIARHCRPIKLQWPPRPPKRDPESPIEPAMLVLRVEGRFALEAQHSAALIIEKVNAHLGWHCVGKLAFRQGPIEDTPRRPRAGAPSAEAVEKAREASEAIEGESLRDALTHLGARIIDEATARKTRRIVGPRR